MRTLTINTDKALSAAEHVRVAMLKCLNDLPDLPQAIHAVLIQLLADRIRATGGRSPLVIQIDGLTEMEAGKIGRIAKHVKDAVLEAEYIFRPAPPSLHILPDFVLLIATEFVVDKGEDWGMVDEEDGGDCRLPTALDAALAVISRIEDHFSLARRRQLN